MRIGIVGAGMAGLACAEAATAAGHEVVLFDKARAPGGRMSTRRVATTAGDAHFDFGAQYFTARDPAFRRRVERWTAAGLVAPWPAAGAEAQVGVPAMNAPLRQMSGTQRVLWSTRVTLIESLGPRWRLHSDERPADVDCAVIALPAEQAAALLGATAPGFAARAAATPSEPCWTGLLAFSAPVPAAAGYLRGEDVIGSASRNNSKPGRTTPESWVIHASPGWSTRHLEADPPWITRQLHVALAQLLGTELPPLLSGSSHRWRYARSGAEGSAALWDGPRRLGVCGDWLIGPRVEAAWLSGTRLAERMQAG